MDIIITLILVVGYLVYPKLAKEAFKQGFKEGINGK